MGLGRAGSPVPRAIRLFYGARTCEQTRPTGDPSVSLNLNPYISFLFVKTRGNCFHLHQNHTISSSFPESSAARVYPTLGSEGGEGTSWFAQLSTLLMEKSVYGDALAN